MKNITQSALFCWAFYISVYVVFAQDTYPTACIDAQKQKAIQAISKECRPDPAIYLSAKCVKQHKKQFAKGASYLTTKDILDRFGRKLLGRQDGQFVMPTKELNKLIDKKGVTIADIEKELGIPASAWKGKVLVKIDIAQPEKLNLRIPKGNEAGANELWIPGGKLPTGYTEGVVNQIPEGTYKETILDIK